MKQKNKKLKKYRIERFYIILSIFIILISIFGIYIILFEVSLFKTNDFKIEIKNIKEIQKAEVKKENECINCQARFLDGLMVSQESSNLYSIALILDNNPITRPVKALNKASLVYELPIEGGSTRYLAILSSDTEVNKVGPIRSARPYFIDLAIDSSALLVHCGGSNEALSKIRQERLFSMNEFFLGDYFWRDKNIAAPHNIFTKTEHWLKYLERVGLSEVNQSAWLFDDDFRLSEDKREIEAISISYSKNYQSNWIFSADDNLFILENYPGEDIISAKNIILLKTSSQVLDEVGRLKIDLIGRGEAILCQKSFCSDIYWQKDSLNNRLRFYNKDDSEISFLPGTTWIHVIAALAKYDILYK